MRNEEAKVDIISNNDLARQKTGRLLVRHSLELDSIATLLSQWIKQSEMARRSSFYQVRASLPINIEETDALEILYSLLVHVCFLPFEVLLVFCLLCASPYI